MVQNTPKPTIENLKMALIAKEGSTYTPVPEGAYPARCVWVIDLGTQTSDGAFGRKVRQQIYVNWELIGETADNGEPMTIGAFFSLSLTAKANLRSTLESWRGRAFTADELKGFDISKLLTAPCIISVKHQPKADGNGIRATISGVMAPMKGQTIPPAVSTITLVDLDASDAKVKVDFLPEWLKKKIWESPEWGRINGFDTSPLPPSVLTSPTAVMYDAMKNGSPPRPFAPAEEEPLPF